MKIVGNTLCIVGFLLFFGFIWEGIRECFRESHIQSRECASKHGVLVRGGGDPKYPILGYVCVKGA